MSKSATRHSRTITDDTRISMEASVDNLTRGLESASKFGQCNLEAVVESSKIAAKAAESLGAEIVAYSKKAYEEGMAAVKQLSACRTVSELVEKQAAFGKTSFENFVAEAARLNEMYVAAAKDACAPLNARLTAAADIVKGYRA